MDYPYSAPPHLTADLPGVGGSLKTEPEDFRVDEVPAYPPSGEGTHLFVRFEKRDLDTKRAVDAIARALDCDPRGAGFAGMKDRRAVTTQWASFEGGDPERALALSLEGIRILEAVRHPHKLRTGHLSANRFELRIRGATPDLGIVRAVLDRLGEVGCPNYFGAQRFGHEGRNVERALRWIADGGKAPRKRFERKLLVSSLQAALFNTVLGKRVEEGLLGRWVEGDLLKKEDTGGMFVAEDREEEQGRLDRFEVSPTGPMFGAKMRWPEGEALAREESVLAGAGLDREHLRSFRKAGEGTRRVLRIRPQEVEASVEDDVIHLQLTLKKGAYATVITREIMKS
jgi:tRNA pseudouridine13 synthase